MSTMIEQRSNLNVQTTKRTALRRQKMSKQENPNVINKVYKYFDLNTFEDKEEKVAVPFTPPADLESALAAIQNDNALILKAITTYLRGEALAKAETEVISKGGKKSVVLAAMKPFKSMPPYNSYFVFEADGKTKKTRTRKLRNSNETITEPLMDKDRQEKEILDLFKANPSILESIKKASLEAIGTDEEESEE